MNTALGDVRRLASRRELEQVPAAAAPECVSGRHVLGDLISLAKPRIIFLLLISTVCPMFLAGHGKVPLNLAFFTLLGGALLSASAGALNCLWDRDIDALMERTKNRPLAAGRLAPATAALFALACGVAGFLCLIFKVNAAAAAVALFGHLFYVVVYTMWLKRRTAQNIVIGGAAGAVPPIVGWVAVTGELTVSALLLFLVVFLWTPPHFWALALNRNDDYRRANVPMLPVVAGVRATHHQMLIYTLLLIPVSILLVLTNPDLGPVSFALLLALGTIFARKTFALQRAGSAAGEEAAAWEIFRFSLLYLALFFICLVVDSTLA